MPTEDLGDYDVEPVEGNPFGAMADSPNNYDVQPVDHDPFASGPDSFQLANPNSASAWPEHAMPTPNQFAAPPGFKSDINPTDRDLLIKTIYGEARGEPALGQAGVAHAILNRVKAGGYGDGISGVVKAPAAGVNPRLGYHEFSPWNTGRATEGQPAIATLDRDRPADYARIGALVDKTYSGLIPDPTGGATHYYGVMRGHPPWSPPLAAQNQTKIGNTTFVGRAQGPGQAGYDPNTLATRAWGGRVGFDDGGGVTDLGFADPSQMSALTDDHLDTIQNLTYGNQDPDSIARTMYRFNPELQDGEGVGGPRYQQLYEAAQNAQMQAVQAAKAVAQPTAEHQAIVEPRPKMPGDVRALADKYFTAQSQRLGPMSGGFTPPHLVGHPFTDLVGSEEHFMRQREGLDMPSSEWTGGRVGFADGGAPDDDDYAGSDQSVPSSVRIGSQLSSQGVDTRPYDSNPLAGITAQARAENATAPPAPEEPAKQYYGGAWGQAAEDAYQSGMNKLGEVQNWLGDKFESGVGKTAAAIGVPAAAGFARDIRAIAESGEGMVGMRHGDPAFPEGRVATRVPTAAAIADQSHLSNAAKIGLDTIQSDPVLSAKIANVTREMPYVKEATGELDAKGKPITRWAPTNLLNIPPDATPEQAHQIAVDHFKSNILALHDAVPEEIRPGSMQWYDGANNRATQQAVRYGRPVENTSGVYAALSPQMDWFKNVSLGDRVMDIMHTQQATPFSPEMWKWARTFAKDDPDTLATYRSMRPTGDYPGRKLGEINDPETQALWLRAYDEAHHSRDYNIVNPDGTFGPKATNADGSNSKVGWGSMDMISKAIASFNAPNMPTISQAMGLRHKMRNFYNNIVAPNSEHGDVTVDTHAIAGANLRPMAGEDKDVDIGLGGSGGKSAATGSNGLYGAYAEAYRKAAEERGILPRQMQSITWEALRGLWSPSEKASPEINAHVQNVWNQYQLGEIDLPTAQRMLIYDEAGNSRITPPDWHTAGWRPSGR